MFHAISLKSVRQKRNDIMGNWLQSTESLAVYLPTRKLLVSGNSGLNLLRTRFSSTGFSPIVIVPFKSILDILFKISQGKHACRQQKGIANHIGSGCIFSLRFLIQGLCCLCLGFLFEIVGRFW